MTFIYWLLCFLIGCVPAWIVYRNDRKKNVSNKWLPALLRFFTCFLTAALLLAPAFPSVKNEEEKPVLIWLQDNSASVRQALGKDTGDYQDKIRALWTDWRKNYTVVPFRFGNGLEQDTIFRFDERSTDIAGAIQAAMDQYGDQNIGALVLSSDGIYNQGLDPLYISLGKTIPVYTVALGDSTLPKDAAIARVYANKTVTLGNTFEIVADVRAEKLAGNRSTLSVLHKGKPLEQSALQIDKDHFNATFRFQIKATEKGFQRYTLSLPAIEGENNLGNNHIDLYVEVIDEPTRILLLASAPHPDLAAIRAALEDVPGYKLEVVVGKAAPSDMGRFALVIAHQYPAGNAPQLQLQALTVPVWYILGRQSNLAQFNQQQSLLQIKGSSSSLNDALPLLQAGFNFFSLPAGIREVIGQMPPLLAPYGNYTVMPGSQVMLRQQIGQVATTYPLWLMRTGDKPGAVLCGEGLWRWRMYEYKNTRKHEIVDELIRQTVSTLSQRKDARPFRVFMDKYILNDNEPVNLFAELRNENAELVNVPQVRVNLTDSAGKRVPYEMEKNGNSYRLHLGLLSPGNYQYKGSVTYNGKTHVGEGGFVVESVPLELIRTHADYDLLSRLSRQSDGRFFVWPAITGLSDSLRNNSSIRPVIHSDKIYMRWIDEKWLFFFILLSAVAEWLLRKYWSL